MKPTLRRFCVWVLILGSLVWMAPLVGAAPGHPAYLRALSELRSARANLERRTGDAQARWDERHAIEPVDRAIREIREAAISDGKDPDDHPPVDAREPRPGRLHRALNALHAARDDIARDDDNAFANGLRTRALHHIEEAIVWTEQGLAEIEHTPPPPIVDPRPSPPAIGDDPVGCSDGDREGFVDRAAFPNIAGCSGGWSVPGVVPENPGRAPSCPDLPTFDTIRPACGRRAGNASPNPSGAGCNVSDLCSAGWHVCAGANDIANHSSGGCNGATRPGDPPLFFASRQSSTGCGACAAGGAAGPQCSAASCATNCAQTPRTSNDVFGCGNLGATSPLSGCGPINRFSHDHCSALGATWRCVDPADPGGVCEAFLIVHDSPSFGGVLCCHD